MKRNNFVERAAIVVLLAAFCGFVYGQSGSSQSTGPVSSFAITNYPLYGEVMSQDDAGNLSPPVSVRANSAGAVTVTCALSTARITLTLAAGEFVPCQIKRLWDDGTDAIVIHGFY